LVLYEAASNIERPYAAAVAAEAEVSMVPSMCGAVVPGEMRG